MMRPTYYFIIAVLFVIISGCGGKQEPEQSLGPVTETLLPSLIAEPGVAYEIQRKLDQGILKKENVSVSKVGGARYVITGPGPIIAKLKLLAAGEWLFCALQPKTEETRQVIKTHLHKLAASGGLQEEDVKAIEGGWNVVGPREVIEHLQEEIEAAPAEPAPTTRKIDHE